MSILNDVMGNIVELWDKDNIGLSKAISKTVGKLTPEQAWALKMEIDKAEKNMRKGMNDEERY